MRKPKIGIVCTVRKTFDYLTAYELYKERTAEVMKDSSVEWFNYPEMVIEKVVSEFSVYGVILSDNSKYYLNKSVGFLVRSKEASQNEGGIMAGVAAVDIPFLIDMNVNREDESVIEYTF